MGSPRMIGEHEFTAARSNVGHRTNPGMHPPRGSSRLISDELLSKRKLKYREVLSGLLRGILGI